MSFCSCFMHTQSLNSISFQLWFQLPNLVSHLNNICSLIAKRVYHPSSFIVNEIIVPNSNSFNHNVGMFFIKCINQFWTKIFIPNLSIISNVFDLITNSINTKILPLILWLEKKANKQTIKFELFRSNDGVLVSIYSVENSFYLRK